MSQDPFLPHIPPILSQNRNFHHHPTTPPLQKNNHHHPHLLNAYCFMDSRPDVRTCNDLAPAWASNTHASSLPFSLSFIGRIRTTTRTASSSVNCVLEALRVDPAVFMESRIWTNACGVPGIPPPFNGIPRPPREDRGLGGCGW